MFDRHFLDGFRQALPQAQVHAFEDANHYVLEDKADVLVPAIRAFLDDTSLDDTSLDDTSLDGTSLDSTSLDSTSLDSTSPDTPSAR